MKLLFAFLVLLSVTYSTRSSADCRDNKPPNYFSVSGDLSELTGSCPFSFPDENRVDCSFHLLRVLKNLDSEKYRQQKERMRVEIEVAERGYKDINEREFEILCALGLQSAQAYLPRDSSLSDSQKYDLALKAFPRGRGTTKGAPDLYARWLSACQSKDIRGLERALSAFPNSPLEKEKFEMLCLSTKESRDKFRREIEADVRNSPNPEYAKADKRLKGR